MPQGACAALLLVAAAVAAAAPAAAAAADTCPSASWRRLPIATKPATLEQLDLPDGWQVRRWPPCRWSAPPPNRCQTPTFLPPAPCPPQTYLKSSIVPHVIGPAVALVLALIFLLTFLIWRLVKLCCACWCACARGPQRSGSKARALLTGKRHRWVQGLAAAMAIGVLGGRCALAGAMVGGQAAGACAPGSCSAPISQCAVPLPSAALPPALTSDSNHRLTALPPAASMASRA